MNDSASHRSTFIDPARRLVIPNGTPPAVALLAGDLHRYGQLGKPPKRRPRTSSASTTYVLSEEAIRHPIAGDVTASWEAMLTMPFEKLSAATVARVNEYLANESAEYPAALPASWGLYLLSRASDDGLSNEEVVNFIAMAGRCAGLAALADGVTRASRRASRKRWDPLDEIKADIKQRWQDQKGTYRSKAEFIREVAPEVLRRSRAIKGPLTESSTPGRIRKWLSE